MTQARYPTAIDTIGNTPLIRLVNITKELKSTILIKSEFRNPLFSIKDRIAKSIIRQAEKTGELKPGGIIIEPTSGNTGIALAALARSLGYKCILTMPETMSQERRTLLLMLGAEIILTPGSQGMKGAIAKSIELLEEYGDKAFAPRQFDNPANPTAHYQTTGPEIIQATNGDIAAFVAGVGTGGTISGAGKYIKEHSSAKIIAVEPAGSPVLSGGKPGPHKIQGIGAGFIPGNLDQSLLDEIITVTDQDAIHTAQQVTSQDGIPVGISSGASIWAALQLAKRPEYEGKTIVAIAASSTERYMSTPLAEAARTHASSMAAVDLISSIL